MRLMNKLCKFYKQPSQKRKGATDQSTVEEQQPEQQDAPNYNEEPPTIDEEIVQMADEMDNMDAIPFDSDDDSDAFYSAASEFSSK